MDITAVPRTPSYVKGIINLRGNVIRVVDLRKMFDMDHAAVTDQTCIIVVESLKDNCRVQTGIVVDHVSEVLDIAAEQIEPSPRFDDSGHSDFILGIGKICKSVKILLDIDRVLVSTLANEYAMAS
jgi:purine-binding chemotaxis protein CheW